MEDSNIIIFLDKIDKLIELGNIPKATQEIKFLLLELERKISKNKGKRFQLLPNQLNPNDVHPKLNEIITFLNDRFPLN